MQKKIFMLSLAFLAFNYYQVSAAGTPNNISIMSTGARVCFVDFRIGLVIGKSETEIGDARYCRYVIDRKKFISLLVPVPSSTFYMRGNVRAKVSMSDKNVYFIDYNGVVRHGREKFEINKMTFTHALRGLDVDVKNGEGEKRKRCQQGKGNISSSSTKT